MEGTKQPLLSDDEIELPAPPFSGASQSSSSGSIARRRHFEVVGPPGGGAALAAIREPSEDSEGEALEARGGGGAAAAGAPEEGEDAQGSRQCFICLMEGDADNPLVRCCSTCYARTHRRCWREWRNNQRLTALRSRLLGLPMQTNHLLQCTICKSGTAMLEGEEGALQWMVGLLSGSEAGGRVIDTIGPLLGAQPRRDSSDDDAQLEDLVDMRTCVALIAYLGVLVLVLLVACVLIVTRRFYAGDVVLCCVIALYELSILQVVALVVARRRGASLAAAGAGGGGGDGSENRVDVEAQRQARDLPIPHSV